MHDQGFHHVSNLRQLNSYRQHNRVLMCLVFYYRTCYVSMILSFSLHNLSELPNFYWSHLCDETWRRIITFSLMKNEWQGCKITTAKVSTWDHKICLGNVISLVLLGTWDHVNLDHGVYDNLRKSCCVSHILQNSWIYYFSCQFVMNYLLHVPDKLTQGLASFERFHLLSKFYTLHGSIW